MRRGRRCPPARAGACPEPAPRPLVPARARALVGRPPSSSRSGRGTAATAHQRDIPHEMKTEVGRLPEGGGGRRWLAARSRALEDCARTRGFDRREACYQLEAVGRACRGRTAGGKGFRTQDEAVRAWGRGARARIEDCEGKRNVGREAQFSLRWARRCLPSRCRGRVGGGIFSLTRLFTSNQHTPRTAAAERRWGSSSPPRPHAGDGEESQAGSHHPLVFVPAAPALQGRPTETPTEPRPGRKQGYPCPIPRPRSHQARSTPPCPTQPDTNTRKDRVHHARRDESGGHPATLTGGRPFTSHAGASFCGGA